MPSMRTARPELSKYVTLVRSTTTTSGFLAIIVRNDSATSGETWRSISPSSGKTFGCSFGGIGRETGAVFLISPKHRWSITNRAYQLDGQHRKDHRSKYQDDVPRVFRDSTCRSRPRWCARRALLRRRYLVAYRR